MAETAIFFSIIVIFACLVSILRYIVQYNVRNIVITNKRVIVGKGLFKKIIDNIYLDYPAHVSAVEKKHYGSINIFTPDEARFYKRVVNPKEFEAALNAQLAIIEARAKATWPDVLITDKIGKLAARLKKYNDGIEELFEEERRKGNPNVPPRP